MSEPLVDIIMLVHDQPSWADLAIRSVEAFTKNPYRLIIVDNASELPETKFVLKEAEERGHLVIHVPENKSFSNGVNIGVGAGRSKFIIILNDDAIVTEGWDGALMQEASAKHVGLVGSRVIGSADGHMGNPALVGKPPYLVFVSVCLRRNVWDAVGALDEQTFDGFSSEDLDYSWRVLKAGYELKVAERSIVMHAGSRTLAKTMAVGGDALATQQAMHRNNEKYNARLLDKWGKDWVTEHAKLEPKVLVMSYHPNEWTRVEFMDALNGLKKAGGFPYVHGTTMRAAIHIARQTACDFALDNGFDYLLQLDDDATFPPDVLRRLLAHNKPVVTALAYQRKPPHWPCVFEVGDDGMLGRPLEGIEHTGLRKVDVSGYHCSLLNTRVIKTMREGLKNPDGTERVKGTRQYFGGFENKVGEDFAFSLNLKKYEIPLYCDTELISGHIGSSIVVDEAYKRSYEAQVRR